MSTHADAEIRGPTLFGHPSGLFALFFAEMWERFSYYGMRALLVFYMIKGFLGYEDRSAYAVYGAYAGMVYMTPYFGGMLADRLLGARRAVVLGGLLMAAGHLTMTVENSVAFYAALGLLIVGNGFFKPNISTIVGGLYPEGSHKRDGGFTIFYMGINLGAAMAPLLCGYVGETYGWHYGFGLATVGMLVGLAIFVVPVMAARLVILAGALVTAVAMVALQDTALLLAVNGFVALALAAAGVIAFVALGRGGLPDEAGAPPDPDRLARPLLGPLSPQVLVYIGAFLSVPLFALLVSANRGVRLVPESTITALAGASSPFVRVAGTFLDGIATPAGVALFASGFIALAYILGHAFRAPKVERERLFVVVTLMFFSLLFWAFFEQAGSSISNFTDRNVDRVAETHVVTEQDVGRTLEIPATQEQVGYPFTGRVRINGRDTDETWDGRTFLIGDLDRLRTLARQDAEERGLDASPTVTLLWEVGPEDVGMGWTDGGAGVPASTFQSANPIFILLFGLVFTWLWGVLDRFGLEPSTPVKFALGLLQLGAGFGVLWYGAAHADARGMVWVGWLLLGYLLHTTGELCLSPVGLSMVTRLSPRQLVSTVMGAWFLATSFSSFLAGIIAQFTGVGGEGEAGGGAIPAPIETVGIYGGVFFQIAIAAAASGVVVLLLSPVLKRWMHEAA